MAEEQLDSNSPEFQEMINNTRKPEDTPIGHQMLERMNAGHHEELANWGLEQVKGDLTTSADCLDAGCGGGANIARLLERCPEGTATGIDYSPTSVEVATQYNSEAIASGKAKVVEGDVSSLPFEDNSFDAITAFETVYFWPEMGKAMSEMFRVARPGGFMMICNEDDGEDVDDWTSQIEGYKSYDAKALCMQMLMAGFGNVHVYTKPENHWLAVVGIKPGV